MNQQVTRSSASQEVSSEAMNSRPLSERMNFGLPWEANSSCRERRTWRAPMEGATQQPTQTLVYSSTTLRILMAAPPRVRTDMKS